jgi:hypothetical protein
MLMFLASFLFFSDILDVLEWGMSLRYVFLHTKLIVKTEIENMKRI